jgi:hypothetical protein
MLTNFATERLKSLVRGQSGPNRPLKGNLRKMRLADRAELFDGVEWELQVLVGGKETPEVAKGLFTDCHLPQVVVPDVSFDGSAGERLAADGLNFALAVHARVGSRWHDEAHLRAFLPEGSGEIMRENQGIIAALGGEDRCGILDPRPIL